MEKTVQLYEGKAKKVFATEDPALVIVSYKDWIFTLSFPLTGDAPGAVRKWTIPFVRSTVNFSFSFHSAQVPSVCRTSTLTAVSSKSPAES